MISDTLNYFNSPVRSVNARVELYENSALADVYNKYYALKSFSIERVGESKFFGFGICQKLNVHLVDKDRYIYITTIDSFKPYLSTNDNYINSFPEFYVTEVHRDENTNELSVTAYDAIYKAAAHTVNELNLDNFPTDSTIKDIAVLCAYIIGVECVIDPKAANSFSLVFDTIPNLDGTETLREVLNALAEVTQTIYYIDGNNKLVFKRLDISGNAVLEIGKEDYFTLDSGENRRLATITHATELGDNVSVSTSTTGSTQYVRDNPFWDLREDIDTLLNNALDAVGGLTINQFSCSWRGNPLVEIGDKISLVTKDNNTVISYLLDDVIYYDGTLKQDTQWKYADNEEETESNPVSLGDALKKTYARVDKVNREIELVASETGANTENISSLLLNTDSLNATVRRVEENTTAALESTNESLSNLASQVSAKMSAEDVQLQIETELANGVDRVVTSTGFTFNEEGLTVSKTDSEMTTTITENGMQVYKNGEVVLTANNIGVDAVNLHATTYLIIGNYSRFEDFGSRTGCFWIGG